MSRVIVSGKFRVTITDDVAKWECQTINKTGKRIIWKLVMMARYDNKLGFWGGLPHGITNEEYTSVENSVKQSD